MQRSGVAALIFLTGLFLAAWFAARQWESKIIARFFPIAYCILFGFAYSTLVLGSNVVNGLVHGLMASIVGVAIVFALWVDSGTRARRDH
jgi:hypothetical protein